MNSRNFRVGSGGRSVWRGLPLLFEPVVAPVCEAPRKTAARFESTSSPRGVLTALGLGPSTASSRERTEASHKPTATSSTAIATNRCFAFMVRFDCDLSSHSSRFAIVCEVSGTDVQFGTNRRNSGAKHHREGMKLIRSGCAEIKRVDGSAAPPRSPRYVGW